MKKIFKKNQIIITALAVMIAAAGYISYSDAQLKGKKDKTAKTETSSETETSVNMDQVLQDMENLDLDVTDEIVLPMVKSGNPMSEMILK